MPRILKIRRVVAQSLRSDYLGASRLGGLSRLRAVSDALALHGIQHLLSLRIQHPQRVNGEEGDTNHRGQDSRQKRIENAVLDLSLIFEFFGCFLSFLVSKRKNNSVVLWLSSPRLPTIINLIGLPNQLRILHYKNQVNHFYMVLEV